MQKFFILVVFSLFGFITPNLAHASVQCGPPNKSQNNTVTCYADPAFNANAICNDGTQPMFWYRPGYGSGLNKWIFWFEGGGQCEDQASCAYRITKPQASTEITSNGFTSGVGMGLLNLNQSESPLLYNTNVVYMHYCSSDTWIGNTLGNGQSFNINDSDTWAFKGRAIAQVLIKSVEEYQPNIFNATSIIIGGDSAGGVGATNNFHDVVPILPNTQLLLVNDGAFSNPIGEYVSTNPAPYVYTGPFSNSAYYTGVTQRLFYWGNTRGDAVCDAQATTQAQHQACYDTSNIMQNYITVPQFTATSMIDTAQTSQELCPTLWGYCNVPHDPKSTEGQYVTYFGQVFTVNVTAQPTPTYMAFVPDQYEHVILNDMAVFTTAFTFNNTTYTPQTVFDAWLQNAWNGKPSVGVMLGTGPGVQ